MHRLMKCSTTATLLLILVSSTSAAAAPDRAVTRVIKLLDEMMEKSKADGEKERELYAKLKCYYDTNKAEKTAENEALAEVIGTIDSNIGELKGETGVLSSECAKLKADIESNLQTQAEAEHLRSEERTAFVETKENSLAAISQLSDAIKTLSEIGADQTITSGAEHAEYMAEPTGSFLAKKVSVVDFHSQVKEALHAANCFMSPGQKFMMTSFLQDPAGAYSAQSGEILGILKDMRDTFEANLATATATEKSQAEAYSKYEAQLLDEHATMSSLYDTKQSQLGDSDSSLSAKKSQLETSIEQKKVNEDFLAELIPMYEQKTKEYEARNALREGEEAAIAEAISILNSDAAFKTFGKVDATSLMQISTIRLHVPHIAAAEKEEVQRLLASSGSTRLALLATKLRGDSNNPFQVVLSEIEKMQAVLVKEGKSDKEQLDFCVDERAGLNKALEENTNEMKELEMHSQEVQSAIENPETGLQAMLQTQEASLTENEAAQKEESSERKEAADVYAKDIKDLVEAQTLLVRAMKVLKSYYDKMEGGNDGTGSEKSMSDQPATWDGEYEGQSKPGANVISMLEFIMAETKKEEAVAHQDEQGAQSAYENSMAMLVQQQRELMESIVQTKEALAEHEQDLFQTKKNLELGNKEKAAMEANLESIKLGCDFITTNFQLRVDEREKEGKALALAIELIKKTPAYLSAEATS
jgi:hypothetical protein